MCEEENMLEPTIVEAINKQIEKEFFSAYLYYEIANYYGQKGLNGFQNWYMVQTKEELDHAHLFVQYLIDKGETPILSAIQSPSKRFEDFKEPLQLALEHERYITRSIHELYASVDKEKDYHTKILFEWFIKEQGEEEKNAEELITRYELFVEGDKKALYDLNNELASRVYTETTMDTVL